MRTKVEIKTFECNWQIECWTMFDILSGCCFEQLFKRIIYYIISDPVITFVAEKSLKLPEKKKKKIHGMKYPLHWE